MWAREANSQGCRDMGLLPDTLPGQLPIGDAAVRDRLGKLWGVQPPVEPGQSLAQMLAGGVKGLMVVGLDPAAEPATAQALQGLDFLVVQDLFLTETAKLAEVVLPACSFAEADGTYTNLERRVQRGPEGIQRRRPKPARLGDPGCAGGSLVRRSNLRGLRDLEGFRNAGLEA